MTGDSSFQGAASSSNPTNKTLMKIQAQTMGFQPTSQPVFKDTGHSRTNPSPLMNSSLDNNPIMNTGSFSSQGHLPSLQQQIPQIKLEGSSGPQLLGHVSSFQEAPQPGVAAISQTRPAQFD